MGCITKFLIISFLVLSSSHAMTAETGSTSFGLMNVEAFPKVRHQRSVDLLVLSSGEDRVELTCTTGNTELKITKLGQPPVLYQADDFYSNGCKSLMSSLEILKLTAIIDFEFFGPDVYPSLILGLGSKTLVYTPSGSMTRGFKKQH